MLLIPVDFMMSGVGGGGKGGNSVKCEKEKMKFLEVNPSKENFLSVGKS